MLVPRALPLLCTLSCAWWLHGGAASRLKSPALPIQSEKEPLPSKGLSGKRFTHMSAQVRFLSLKRS